MTEKHCSAKEGPQNPGSVFRYEKADRNHMRRILQKGSVMMDQITADPILSGSVTVAELADLLSEEFGYEPAGETDEDASEELKNDRCLLIGLAAAIRKDPGYLPYYAEMGSLFRKYGLFDEEVVLLENAESRCSGADLNGIKNQLETARQCRAADDAGMDDAERTAETLRRALRKKPMDIQRIRALLKECTADDVLYEIACNTDRDPDMRSIREKAACRIQNRDYQYALSTEIQNSARTAMILNLYDSLKGDEPFIARTILTDPKDENKVHMLLYCEDEELLMLAWKYVYGARKICTDRLHALGSRWPDAYMDMDPQEKAKWEECWMICAGETAQDLISEDRAVRERLSGTAFVDSEPLRFFLSLNHPRKAIRWWNARKLKNPVYIAYAGSWTEDDPIKEALSVKISSTALITEMMFGDLSAVNPIFAFKKPEDLTPQNRFLAEIMKNNPDRKIREHARMELLRSNTSLPGIDLTKPDPLYKGR
jgi:hypothetical protein